VIRSVRGRRRKKEGGGLCGSLGEFPFLKYLLRRLGERTSCVFFRREGEVAGFGVEGGDVEGR